MTPDDVFSHISLSLIEESFVEIFRASFQRISSSGVNANSSWSGAITKRWYCLMCRMIVFSGYLPSLGTDPSNPFNLSSPNNQKAHTRVQVFDVLDQVENQVHIRHPCLWSKNRKLVKGVCELLQKTLCFYQVSVTDHWTAKNRDRLNPKLPHDEMIIRNETFQSPSGINNSKDLYLFASPDILPSLDRIRP